MADLSPKGVAAPPTSDLSRVLDETDLRRRFAKPMSHVEQRQLDRLEVHSRRFIAASPLLLIASSHSKHGVDVSPRGDAPGFVKVLDEQRILIPDRPGNNRLDTMANILDTPSVGTLFLIPGIRETLRINGEAIVSDDHVLCDACAVNGRPPRLVIVVEIRELFLHCGKAIIRSRLWDDIYRLQQSQMPSLAEMTADQIGRSDRLEDIEVAVGRNYRENLY